MLTSAHVREAFDLEQESAAMRELYLKLEKLLAELDTSLKIRPVPAQ